MGNYMISQIYNIFTVLQFFADLIPFRAEIV